MKRVGRLLVGAAVVATLVVVQAQTTPQAVPQTPAKPTSPNLPTPQATGQTTGVPPPPPQVNGLTPPIQTSTPTAKVPPLIDVPPPPVPTPGVPITPLTAEDAARLALHFQPSVAIAAAQIMDARGVLVQTKSALFPNIGLKESYGQSDNYYGSGANGTGIGSTGGNTGTTTGGSTSGTTGTTSGTTGTTSGTTGTTAGTTGTTSGNGNTFVNNANTTNGLISLSQLIYDFNHTLNLVRAADYQLKAAQQSYVKAQIDTVLTVKQDYYTFVQNQGQVDVQQAAVTSTQASLDVAQAELNAGLGAPADVVNAKTTLANDVEALIQARDTMVTSRIALCLAMGIDPRTPLVPAQPTSEPPEDERDMNTLVGEAVQHRPDVLAAIATLKSAGYTVLAAQSSNAPSLSVSLNNSNLGSNIRPVTGLTLSAQISLTWQIDDGGFAAGKIESANAQAEVAKQQLQITTQTVISDVSQAWVNVKTAEQRVDNANTQVENAIQNLKLAQGQYAAGVTPFVTVITAQASLTQAKSDQVNAVANLAQARATLRHAVGLGL